MCSDALTPTVSAVGSDSSRALAALRAQILFSFFVNSYGILKQTWGRKFPSKSGRPHIQLRSTGAKLMLLLPSQNSAAAELAISRNASVDIDSTNELDLELNLVRHVVQLLIFKTRYTLILLNYTSLIKRDIHFSY